MTVLFQHIKALAWLVLSAVLFLFASLASAADIYVNVAAPSGGDGTITYPFNDLPYALSVADHDDKLIVAHGIYYPGTNRSDSFIVDKHIHIDGGWNPTFTTWVRDPSEETILSGNIGAFNDATDNCYTVLKLSNSGMNDSNTVISNLTITGGYANGTTSATYSGGGVRVTAGAPRFHNCKIKGNVAGNADLHTGQGGGVYVYNASPIFTVCTIAENSMTPAGTTGNGTGVGAGIYIYGSGLTAKLIDCTIRDNGNVNGRSGSVLGGGIAFETSGAVKLVN